MARWSGLGEMPGEVIMLIGTRINRSVVRVGGRSKRLIILCLGLMFLSLLLPQLPFAQLAPKADVPRIDNPWEPPSREVWSFRELWRVGGEEDGDLLLGQVNDVISDSSGSIYILDRQMCQVNVLSSSGEFLRTLSRSGDGPGEVRMPGQLLLIDDQTIGIVLGYPSKVVKVTKDDLPAGTAVIGSSDPGDRAARITGRMDYRDNHLVVLGSKMTFGAEGQSTTQYLARFDDQGCEEYRFAEFEEREGLKGNVWRINERENFFPALRWALGEAGAVYIAPDRDRYEIHQISATGELMRIISREFNPSRRTKEDFDEIKGQYCSNVTQLEYKFNLEDFDPAIQSIAYQDDGFLRVSSCYEAEDLPDGAIRRYDFFDQKGHFIKEVVLELPFNATEDELYHLSGNRIARVTGAKSAQMASARASGFSSGNESEDRKDPDLMPPLQVILYERAGVREVE